jgi:hypothetical protein
MPDLMVDDADTDEEDVDIFQDSGLETRDCPGFRSGDSWLCPRRMLIQKYAFIQTSMFGCARRESELSNDTSILAVLADWSLSFIASTNRCSGLKDIISLSRFCKAVYDRSDVNEPEVPIQPEHESVDETDVEFSDVEDNGDIENDVESFEEPGMRRIGPTWGRRGREWLS